MRTSVDSSGFAALLTPRMIISSISHCFLAAMDKTRRLALVKQGRFQAAAMRKKHVANNNFAVNWWWLDAEEVVLLLFLARQETSAKASSKSET